MDSETGFKPPERKILVATHDDKKAVDTTPAPHLGDADKAAETEHVTVSRPPAPQKPARPEFSEGATTIETPAKPEITHTDKTSFPPAATAEEAPADLEALHRQYHIPVGKVARKFSPRRHLVWLGIVVLVAVAVAVWMFIEPQL